MITHQVLLLQNCRLSQLEFYAQISLCNDRTLHCLRTTNILTHAWSGARGSAGIQTERQPYCKTCEVSCSIKVLTNSFCCCTAFLDFSDDLLTIPDAVQSIVNRNLDTQLVVVKVLGEIECKEIETLENRPSNGESQDQCWSSQEIISSI